MTVQNPNWPRLQALWSPSGHVGFGRGRQDYVFVPWADISSRLIGPWSFNRGRQYELDQVTAGTWSGVLDNRDGLFDTGTTGSAAAGNVAPYQPFRLRAQWPATANLLDPDLATAGEASGLAAGSGGYDAGMVADYSLNASWLVATSSSAWQGAKVWQLQLPAGSPAGAALVSLAPQPLPAGVVLPWAFSIRIRCTTAGANLTVTPFLQWLDTHGAVISTVTVAPVPLTGAAGGAWSFAGVPGTAPAGALSAVVGLTLTSAPATAFTVEVDGLQFEQNTGATGFVVPGAWFDLFTGGIERYPQTWRAGGTLGFVQAVAVDALALLSQSRLRDPFLAAALSYTGGVAPSFAYLLGDASTTFVDATGQRPPATAGANLGGPGVITPGVARTAASPAGLFTCPVGTSVVHLDCTPAGGDLSASTHNSFIRIPAAPGGLAGPGAGGGGFTRMIAFRVTTAPVSRSAIWMASTVPGAPTFQQCVAGLVVDPDLSVKAVVMDLAHQGAAATVPIAAVSLGNWSIAFLWVSGDGLSFGGSLDGFGQSGTTTVPLVFPPDGYRNDAIGVAFLGTTNPDQAIQGLAGDVALAIEWPGALPGSQYDAILAAWRTGWAGDTPGGRALRILTAAFWGGPFSLDDGVTAALSAATDIDGLDAISALQAVADTEGGVLFADTGGQVVLQARSARWNPPAAAIVLGENRAGGEWPYEDSPVFDFDPTLVTNFAEVTHYATGTVLTATDQASQTANGFRDRQVTSQAVSVQECQDKATYLVRRYKAPARRVASVTLNPSAIPAMWPVVLGLEIGTRIKVIRRPPAPAATVVVDGWVENISWSADITGAARVTLQISPIDPTVYGFYDASTFDNFVFAY